MNGTKEQKAGNQTAPTLWNTFTQAIKLIFFKEQPFIILFIDKRTTFNLISIFLIMFLIPVKDPITNKIMLNPERIIESLLITFIYIGILFLFIMHRKINFVGFLRIFMAMEVIDIFNLITLILSGNSLKLAMAISVSWYLSLSVVTISRLGGISYIRATFAVIATFLFVNLIPALA